MELWIRSQNKEILIQVDNVCLDEFVNYNGIDIITKIKPSGKIGILGQYKTKERALEVLDEIQSKLKATFLMKPKNDNYSKYVEDGKRYLEELNDISIVTGDRCFNLEPINSDVYVYEMPKE